MRDPGLSVEGSYLILRKKTRQRTFCIWNVLDPLNVRGEMCLWYVIQDLMKLQDASGSSGQGKKGGPSLTLLSILCGCRDPRLGCSFVMAVSPGTAWVLELILSLLSLALLLGPGDASHLVC